MKTRVFLAFLGSIVTVLAPMSANAAPPKPHHTCPKGEHWVLQPKFLNDPAHWECVSNKPLPPPK
jgi:hypothetical protein